jgi:DNA mismatch repair protein MutL
VFGPRDAGGSAHAFVDRVRELREEARRVARERPADDHAGREARSLCRELDRDLDRDSGGGIDEAGGVESERVRTESRPSDRFAAPVRTSRAVRVHDTYIVVEDADGMLIVDQHALHERVMFQRLLERVERSRGEGGGLESQSMLTPLVADVEPSALALLDELRPLLARLSIDAEAMGPRSVGVRTFPSLLLSRGVEPAVFVADLLEDAGREPLPPGEEAALHRVLDMMACKAAVKAGDRLSDTEVDELLRLRDSVERSSSCPHGRPTSVRVTLPQLERLFHRR